MATTVFERHRPPASLVRESLEGSRHATFWLDDLPPQPDRPALAGARTADLVVVGGGYTGLWTAILAKERDPERASCCSRRERSAGRRPGATAASSRRASPTARRTASAAGPRRCDGSTRLGPREPRRASSATVAELGHGRRLRAHRHPDVAIEPHQVEWLERDRATPATTCYLDEDAGAAPRSHSPTYLGGRWDKRATALVHPAKLAAELARVAAELGVEIFERLARAGPRRRATAGAVQPCVTDDGRVRAARVALATNVFPSPAASATGS